MLFSLFFIFSLSFVPADSPSCDGYVAVYGFDISQPNLPTPFYSVLVSVSVFMALPTVFHSINSPNSPFSHSVLPVFISAFSILSAVYLFVKVSFSPDIIFCGQPGLKYQVFFLFFHRHHLLLLLAFFFSSGKSPSA